MSAPYIINIPQYLQSEDVKNYINKNFVDFKDNEWLYPKRVDTVHIDSSYMEKHYNMDANTFNKVFDGKMLREVIFNDFLYNKYNCYDIDIVDDWFRVKIQAYTDGEYLYFYTCNRFKRHKVDYQKLYTVNIYRVKTKHIEYIYLHSDVKFVAIQDDTVFRGKFCELEYFKPKLKESVGERVRNLITPYANLIELVKESNSNDSTMKYIKENIKSFENSLNKLIEYSKTPFFENNYTNDEL